MPNGTDRPPALSSSARSAAVSLIGSFCRMGKPRKVPRKFSMPWGDGQVVEEVGVDTEHESEVVIQLLRYDDFEGDTLRFCQYWADGRFQRQPMMMSEELLPAMRTALESSPRIRELLQRLVAD